VPQSESFNLASPRGSFSQVVEPFDGVIATVRSILICINCRWVCGAVQTTTTFSTWQNFDSNCFDLRHRAPHSSIPQKRHEQKNKRKYQQKFVHFNWERDIHEKMSNEHKFLEKYE